MTVGDNIVEIEYGHTFNLGDYESMRVSCRVMVGLNQTPEEAFRQARAFVFERYEEVEDVARTERAIEALRASKHEAEYKLEQVNQVLAEALRKYEQVRAKLAEMGMPQDRLNDWLQPISVERVTGLPAEDKLPF